MDAEVIVVGAGPAGSSTAYHLARKGRSVLLVERASLPRDKSCGDAVTRAGCRLLVEMGVVSRLTHAQVVCGVRVTMRGRGQREFRYPPGLAEPDHGLVVPRMELDHALCQLAVAAGTELWEKTRVHKLLWSNGSVVGVEIIRDGQRMSLYAPVVVAADGATSCLAREAGLVATPSEEMGFGIRGYYHAIKGLGDLLELYMPLMDPSDRHVLPSYGWVFPTGPSSANIGVGIIKRVSGTNVRDLLERFVEYLRQTDSRFVCAELRGQWRGAPLRFDFVPEHCGTSGLLLVGDAAGMISPFTGEGISYALESGKLAAETIHHNLKPGQRDTPALTEYGQLLSSKYVGYFEAGRQSARRYQLLWHVLESTFQNEKPIFVMCRQAALFPEGVGESPTSILLDNVGPLINDGALPVRADLLAIGEILLDTVRRDWPFLSRVVTSDELAPEIPLRPALLVLLSGYVGQPQREYMILVGAAIELGYLAALSHMSVGEDDSGISRAKGGRAANWGNMFAVVAGDFLFSNAFELSAQVGAGVTRQIAQALARACEGQVRELRNAYNPILTQAEHLEIMTQKVATLLELPCSLGAQLGKASPTAARALKDYGRYLGLAYQLTEDCRHLMGQEDRYGKAAISDLRQGVYSLPVLLALDNRNKVSQKLHAILDRAPLKETEIKTATRLVRDCGAVDEAMDVAWSFARRAQRALGALPDGPARRSLFRLADYAVSRQLPTELAQPTP